MQTNSLIQMVENQRWIEPLEQRLQDTVATALSEDGVIGPKTANFLHGTWLGHPLHPVLTDIPIGSWTATVVLDAMEGATGRRAFGRGADVALVVGLAGAAGAALTGLADWSKIGKGRKRRVGFAHALLNVSSVLCYVASLSLRQRRMRRAGRGLALLGYTISSAAAYLGGHLVYSQQIGVDHTAPYSPPREFVAVLAEDALRENQPTKVLAQGTPVVLVRRSGTIYALVDTCAHLGGPLSEGKIDGESIVCPWHGSRYALADGTVLNGPSAHPQPAFEVRVRDGQIEVRAA